MSITTEEEHKEEGVKTQVNEVFYLTRKELEYGGVKIPKDTLLKKKSLDQLSIVLEVQGDKNYDISVFPKEWILVLEQGGISVVDKKTYQ